MTTATKQTQFEELYLGTSQVKDLKTPKFSETELSTATPRVKHLREQYMLANRYLDIERARFFYEYYYKSDDWKKYSKLVAQAKFFEKYLMERTIYIEDGQLFAGSFGKCQRATPMFPETIGKEMMKEYRKLPSRRIDAFDISDEELDELDEMLNTMDRKSIRTLAFGQLTMEEKSLFLMDPENDPLTLSNIFGVDIAIQGPGGHITPDYQTVLEIGFESIKERALLRLNQAEAENDEKGIDFLKAAIITIDAFGKFANRYSILAKELADKEMDPARKCELLRLSDACSHVPMKPARSFYEACQATWLLFVGIQMEALQKCFCVGRFDQFAYPFYKNDIEKCIITKDEAQEMLDCLFMKFPETNYINSDSNQTSAGFSVQQQFVVGGVDINGNDASNELSYQLIQASINTRLPQPSISLRMHAGTPDSLYRKACELLRLGTGHPSFFCDETIIPSLLNKGILLEDARDYSIVGCSGVQPTRKDKGSHNAGYMNMASCLEFALRDGYWTKGNRQISIHTGDSRNFKTFEEVMEAFKAHMDHLLTIYTKMTVKIEDIQRQLCPTPFLSTFVQDCITRARDRTDGGAVYNSGMTARAVGLATTVDSLAVIKKLVFDDKKITMDELLKAMDANFEGYDELLEMIKQVPKYGNDDDYVDLIGREVTKIYSDCQDKHRSLFGGRFHPGFSSISANVPYGKAVAATANGRKAFTPLSEGISPHHHVEKEGPTAVVLSSAKLYHEGLSGGSILNLRLSPQTVKGEEGLDKLVQFVKGMQKAGIWHAQFNVNDVEMLRDAQKNPYDYADLSVRVAGYSAFFIGLPTMLQDDIIDRSVYTL